ncbi:hypothetical protein EVAR_92563_1 [Eumeta japonica]|uniref:Uncharacterized protein n=1 Tax=Eumeta variegata TaxID=151549 RepID=A0A4C1SZ79_EUMVA|nr:hypothetical protein EVAR_92563_1 [Eumeta japonica]
MSDGHSARAGRRSAPAAAQRHEKCFYTAAIISRPTSARKAELQKTAPVSTREDLDALSVVEHTLNITSDLFKSNNSTSFYITTPIRSRGLHRKPSSFRSDPKTGVSYDSSNLPRHAIGIRRRAASPGVSGARGDCICARRTTTAGPHAPVSKILTAGFMAKESPRKAVEFQMKACEVWIQKGIKESCFQKFSEMNKNYTAANKRNRKKLLFLQDTAELHNELHNDVDWVL